MHTMNGSAGKLKETRRSHEESATAPQAGTTVGSKHSLVASASGSRSASKQRAKLIRISAATSHHDLAASTLGMPASTARPFHGLQSVQSQAEVTPTPIPAADPLDDANGVKVSAALAAGSTAPPSPQQRRPPKKNGAKPAVDMRISTLFPTRPSSGTAHASAEELFALPVLAERTVRPDVPSATDATSLSLNTATKVPAHAAGSQSRPPTSTDRPERGKVASTPSRSFVVDPRQIGHVLEATDLRTIWRPNAAERIEPQPLRRIMQAC
jgi:hypothetical protein